MKTNTTERDLDSFRRQLGLLCGAFVGQPTATDLMAMRMAHILAGSAAALMMTASFGSGKTKSTPCVMMAGLNAMAGEILRIKNAANN